ncbi:MAG: AmmeMemoRadiSam system protein A [Casimicrobiaceae bacterium]
MHDLGSALLTIARSAIAEAFGLPNLDEAGHAALAQPGATFVTLKRRGQLRGCIGSLRPVRPLGVDVRQNAIGAAFRDPRFPPLALAEFEKVLVEVSLLSADERIDVVDENDLLARLRPGVDGLILEYGRQRATFLPQVWDSLPDPRHFLTALKLKAGLPEDFWNAQMNVARYSVTKWSQSEFIETELQQ